METIKIHGMTFEGEAAPSTERYRATVGGHVISLTRHDDLHAACRWYALLSVASCSAMPGAYGATPEDAIANLAPAISRVVDALGRAAADLASATGERAA